MSALNESPTKQGAGSSPVSTGSGLGIRLPPISFLSSQNASNPGTTPGATPRLGMTLFPTHSQSPPSFSSNASPTQSQPGRPQLPQSHLGLFGPDPRRDSQGDENPNKKVKFENSTEQERMMLPRPPTILLYNGPQTDNEPTIQLPTAMRQELNLKESPTLEASAPPGRPTGSHSAPQPHDGAHRHHHHHHHNHNHHAHARADRHHHHHHHHHHHSLGSQKDSENNTEDVTKNSVPASSAQSTPAVEDASIVPKETAVVLEKRTEPTVPVVVKKAVVTLPVLDKAPILEILKEYFPIRHNLGTIVYNPTTTWATVQTLQLYGLKDEHHVRLEELREQYEDKVTEQEYYARDIKYIPCIPPLCNEYINYLLEIKVPYKHVKLFHAENELGSVKRKRELWGGAGGIYSDDSDILSVLMHLGFFNHSIDLSEWNPKWTPKDIIVPLNSNAEDGIHGDVSVTVLLLPTLPAYHGFFRNGINSRTWSGAQQHNGLSYAVYSVSWEPYGSYLKDKSLFKRTQREMLVDVATSRADLAASKGWNFDYDYFKKLQHKYGHKQAAETVAAAGAALDKK